MSSALTTTKVFLVGTLVLGTACGGDGNGNGAVVPPGDGDGDGDVAGSFSGDDDVVGTWDVTFKDGEDSFDCTAEISSSLELQLTCSSESQEYDLDCNESSVFSLTASVDAGTGTFRADYLTTYAGSKCMDYGFTPGVEYKDTEGDAELTRTESGPGSVGGKWTAKYFDWDCIDEDVECTNPMRITSGFTGCTFSLDGAGKIHAECAGNYPDEEGDDWDCNITDVYEGTLGGGKLAVDISSLAEGADCSADDYTDHLTLTAKRH
jgi:hypothetical protein